MVGRSDPATLARMRRVLSRGGDVRAVLTATRTLAKVDDEAHLATSPFLQGFIPPVYLTPLADDLTPLPGGSDDLFAGLPDLSAPSAPDPLGGMAACSPAPTAATRTGRSDSGAERCGG